MNTYILQDPSAVRTSDQKSCIQCEDIIRVLETSEYHVHLLMFRVARTQDFADYTRLQKSFEIHQICSKSLAIHVLVDAIAD